MKPSVLKEVKIISKGIHAKGKDCLQTSGVDDNPFDATAIFSQNIEEFTCRGAVKIAGEFEFQAGILSVNGHLEIRCHEISPFLHH